MPKYYDISIPIKPGMLVWPNDPQPKREIYATKDQQGFEMSLLTIGSHTGTHIDAPKHFLPQDPASVCEIPLENLTGRCQVLEIMGPESREEKCITKADLEKANLTQTKVLFKTGNSANGLMEKPEFDESYVSLDKSAAEYLMERNMHLVGMDYLSIEPQDNPGHPVHQALLEQNIVVLEGVNLKGVPAGEYEIIALPLQFAGSDGCPARVILKELNNK